jgi:hypothetical protein
MAEESRSEIDQAYEDIEREVPARVAGAIKWLRNPEARWIRIPIGVLFIIAGFLWFLPVVGIEFLPVGLLRWTPLVRQLGWRVKRESRGIIAPCRCWAPM